MNRAFLGLLVVLTAATGARAQAPARDNPTTTHGTASIRGRVVDVAGKPLPRVEVRAGGPGAQTANGLTDGAGRYELANLPAGTYTVFATKANYVRTSWGEPRPEGPGKRITLAEGQKLDNINLSLKRGGAVTGKIVDEFGDPVTDVFVNAMRYQYIQGQRRLMPAGGRGGQTNDIGEFRLYGLSPGQYYISATLRNMNPMNVDTNDRTGYAPTFYPGTGNVAQAQRLTIAAGQTVTGINLSLLPIQTAIVTGTAFDVDGKPLATAMVIGTPNSGVSILDRLMGQVRPDGKFTLTGVTPGEYSLRVNTPTGDSATAEVTVNGSDVNDVALVITKPAIIRGGVMFTDSATASGPPKPNVLDLGAVREWALGQQVRSQAKIKEDGTFEISLPAGHVVLRAAPTGAGATPGTPPWRLNRVIYNDLDVGDTGIDVSAGATIENVVVEMTNRSNEVSGRVTDGDGNTVRDCFVIVYAQDPLHWTVQTRHLSVVRPGLDDLFHARLLAGDYYVVAMSDVENGAWTDPEFLTHAREQATRFSIADGETKRVDLPLTPAPVF